MAAVFSVVASAVQVADFGFRLSKSIYDYAEAAVTAYTRMTHLGRDIKLTSATIRELGKVFDDARVQALLHDEALDAAMDAMDACKDLFSKIHLAIEMSKSTAVSFSWPLRQVNVDVLLADLDRLKITLLLLTESLQSARSAHQGQVIEERLVKIEKLLREKHEAVARYEAYLSRQNGEDRILNKIFMARETPPSPPGSPQKQIIAAKAPDLAETHINDLLQLVGILKQSSAGAAANSLPPHEKKMLENSYSNTRNQLDRIVHVLTNAKKSPCKMSSERQRQSASAETKSTKSQSNSLVSSELTKRASKDLDCRVDMQQRSICCPV